MRTLEVVKSERVMSNRRHAAPRVSPARVKNWRRELDIGDRFVCIRPALGLVIYGEIIDHMGGWASVDLARLDAEGRATYERESTRYDAPSMRDFRFSRCYSAAARDGELGDTHVSTIATKLTREEFELARAAGWPDSIEWLSTQPLGLGLDGSEVG